MLAAAPAANAAINVVLPPAAADGSITAEFGQSGIAFGAFNHTFNFTFPSAGTASTGVTSIKVSGKPSTNIDFTSVTLNGKAFAITNGVFDLATLDDWAVPAGVQTLVVQGTSGGNGSYTVDLAFAPVPEPATWAMMIIGFGAAGSMVRARRKLVPTVA
jgi:hypothetical protein